LQFREPCALTCFFVFHATDVIFFAVLLAKFTDAQYTQLLAFGEICVGLWFRFIRVGIAQRQLCSFSVLWNHVVTHVNWAA